MKGLRLGLPALVGLALVMQAAPAYAIDINIGTTGVSGISLDPDGSMQIRYETVGQFFDPDSTSGGASAGFFLDIAGVVYGPQEFGFLAPVTPYATTSVTQPNATTLVFTGSTGPVAGGAATITATMSFTPGGSIVDVDYVVDPSFTTPQPYQAFVYGDLFLEGSDFGIGFHDPITGGVGGINAAGDFGIQLIPSSPTDASTYMEGSYATVYGYVHDGAMLPNTICAGTTAAPYTADPCYIDNGVAMEWAGIFDAVGAPRTIETQWLFGSIAAPPQVPFEVQVDDIDALLAGFELVGPTSLSRGNTSAVQLGVQVTDADTGQTSFQFQSSGASGTAHRVLVPSSIGKTLVVQPVAKVIYNDGTPERIVAAGAPRRVTVTAQAPPPTTMTAIAAYVLQNSGLPVPPGTTICGFNDILNNFAVPSICWAKDEGVTAGVSADLYGPQFPVSRDQMAVFLQRTLNLPPSTPTDAGVTFSDVPSSSFAYGAIYAIAKAGITTGIGGGRYGPADDVSREQMAVFLVQAYSYLNGAAPPTSTSASVFTDVPASSFAYNAIGQLYDLNITAGIDATHYGTPNDVLRDQMAVFLQKLDLAVSS